MKTPTTATPERKMTNDEARAVFDAVIATAPSGHAADDVRLLREYFCNPAFRAAMQDEIWRINQGK